MVRITKLGLKQFGFIKEELKTIGIPISEASKTEVLTIIKDRLFYSENEKEYLTSSLFFNFEENAKNCAEKMLVEKASVLTPKIIYDRLTKAKGFTQQEAVYAIQSLQDEKFGPKINLSDMAKRFVDTLHARNKDTIRLELSRELFPEEVISQLIEEKTKNENKKDSQ